MATLSWTEERADPAEVQAMRDAERRRLLYGIAGFLVCVLVAVANVYARQRLWIWLLAMAVAFVVLVVTIRRRWKVFPPGLLIFLALMFTPVFTGLVAGTWKYGNIYLYGGTTWASVRAVDSTGMPISGHGVPYDFECQFEVGGRIYSVDEFPASAAEVGKQILVRYARINPEMNRVERRR